MRLMVLPMTSTGTSGIIDIGEIVMVRKCKAFTLMELLVVIAIIALIAGMLLPVLSKVRVYAKRVDAKNRMSEIEICFKQYLSDYRKYPDITVTMADSTVMDVLRGATHNSLDLKYMDISTNEYAMGGILDPWNRIYMLSIDNGKGGDNGTAYDRRVNAGPYGEVDKEVVVWSKGADGDDATPAAQKDDVRSWN